MFLRTYSKRIEKFSTYLFILLTYLINLYDFIYFFESKRETERVQSEGEKARAWGGAEREADFPLSKEPDSSKDAGS